MPSKSTNENRQILISLPNNNSKQVDYVIKYKQQRSVEAGTKIHAFFKAIKEIDSKIEIVYLNDKKFTYALLHFPISRLLIEAESTRLEMDLKQVGVMLIKKKITDCCK